MWNSGCHWVIPKADRETNWHWTHLFPLTDQRPSFSHLQEEIKYSSTLPSFGSSYHKSDKPLQPRAQPQQLLGLLSKSTPMPQLLDGVHTNQSRVHLFWSRQHSSVYVWCSVVQEMNTFSTVYGVIIKDVKNNFEKKKYRLFGYCTDSPPAFDMMTAVS